MRSSEPASTVSSVARLPSASMVPSTGQTVPATLPPQSVRPGLRPRHPVAFARLTRPDLTVRGSRTPPCFCLLWGVCVDKREHFRRSPRSAPPDTAVGRLWCASSVSAFGRFSVPYPQHHGAIDCQPNAGRGRNCDAHGPCAPLERNGRDPGDPIAPSSAVRRSPVSLPVSTTRCRLGRRMDCVGQPACTTEEGPKASWIGIGSDIGRFIAGGRNSQPSCLNSDGEDNEPGALLPCQQSLWKLGDRSTRRREAFPVPSPADLRSALRINFDEREFPPPLITFFVWAQRPFARLPVPQRGGALELVLGLSSRLRAILLPPFLL